MEVDESNAACTHNKDDNKQNKDDNQVAVLFSLADKTNHGRVWPEPLLSISTCYLSY